MDEKHYCLVKLSEHGRSFTHLRAGLPKAREKYGKHKGSLQEADSLSELYKLAVNLWNVFPSVIQLLMELEADSQAETAKNYMRRSNALIILARPIIASFVPLLKSLKTHCRQPNKILTHSK